MTEFATPLVIFLAKILKITYENNFKLLTFYFRANTNKVFTKLGYWGLHLAKNVFLLKFLLKKQFRTNQVIFWVIKIESHLENFVYKLLKYDLNFKLCQ